MKTRLLIVLGVLFAAFQNCSVSSMHSENGSFDAASLMASADVSWTIRGQKGVSVSRLNQASRWADRSGSAVTLFPPLMPSTTQIDMAKAPYVKQTSSGPLMNFSPGSFLTTQVGDAAIFASTSYSVLLYIRDLQFPQGPYPRWMRVFEVIPEETGEASGWIGLDAWEQEDGQIEFHAYEYFGATGVASVKLKVSPSSRTSGYGIALRFPTDPSLTYMSVNGVGGEYSVAANPSAMANVNRRLYLHTQFQTEGGFDLAEFGLWKREFSIPEAVYFSSALKEVIEKGGTALVNPGITTVSGDFAKIQGYLSSCMACHGVSSATQVRNNSGVGANSGTKWVNPGDSANSLMIKSLRHQGGASPMPKDQAQLSDAAIAAIAAWIDAGAN